MYQHGELTIKTEREAGGVTFNWEGTADSRDPVQSFVPFVRHLVMGLREKRATFDFRRLTFANSAAVAAVFQLVNLLEEKSVHTQLIYDETVFWQRVNATCMRVVTSRMRHVKVERTSPEQGER
jgi:hypothetical protein